MDHEKNNLILVPASQGLSLGQVISNFKHVAIGDVNVKDFSSNDKLASTAKRWAAIRATTREEDEIIGRFVRGNHRCLIIPSNSNHTDIVFFFDKGGKWAVDRYRLATVASIQWCLDKNVFKPEAVTTMQAFLTKCNQNPLA